MSRTIGLCRLLSLMASLLFAWAIASDVGVLPLLADSDFLRWQPMLLAGLVFWVIGDGLADLRCRCCGSEKVLVRALFTRSHELLCHRCLSWNPVIEPHASAEAHPALFR